DCVFLLLIFFLVAARFEEAEREQSVVLPQASEAMPLSARPKEVIVNVSSQGELTVGGRRLDQPELLAVFQQAAANNPGRQSVLIRADRSCVWEHVMAVMNLCNMAKIRDYYVASMEPAG
ncbi:MAG TPA: biopolymer transporter ExbD, partial [Pirellulales bacterium]|nr:biopolymer transporter ExbD [Pirellulales bacterium]